MMESSTVQNRGAKERIMRMRRILAIMALLAMLLPAAGCEKPTAQDNGTQATCAISYANSYDTPQAYIDDVKPDLIAKATLSEPKRSSSGRRVTFNAHLLDVRYGDYSAGDDIKVWFECDSVDTFMPEGYTTGDELIVLANDGRLRHPNSVWLFDEETYDTLTVEG